jgi:hypothetical protein
MAGFFLKGRNMGIKMGTGGRGHKERQESIRRSWIEATTCWGLSEGKHIRQSEKIEM